MTIRIGIIGTNWIVDEFINAAQELGPTQVQLAAVYSRTPEKGQAFADKHQIPRLYIDLQAFAASEHFDAVYIATPNSLHAQQAILCMEHGKHVLCEKPLASNAREVQHMIDAAKRNHVLLMEAMKSTLLPNFDVIRQNLHRIGPVRRYTAQFCQYSSRYDSYKQGIIENAFKPELSNGALMDLGVYCLYPMVVLFGRPASIQANAYMLGSGVDGQGSLLAAYPEMEGIIYFSKINDSAQPSEIQGELGTIEIHRISRLEKVILRLRDGRVEELTQPQSVHSMAYELQHFITLIRSSQLQSPINSHEHSLITIELTDETRRQIGLRFPADDNKTT